MFVHLLNDTRLLMERIFRIFPGHFQYSLFSRTFPGLEINFFIFQVFQGAWEPSVTTPRAEPRATKFLIEKPHPGTKFFIQKPTPGTKFEGKFVDFKQNLWSNIIITPHLTLFSTIFNFFIAQNVNIG